VPRVPELSAEGPSSAGFTTYSAATSADRISLFSGHLSHQSSSYNAASPALSSSTQARPLSTTTAKMSSQPEHATLLIPGPIEFDDDVLKSMGHYRYAKYSIPDESIANTLQ
jgi:alanine-glyoxylate transaminase/serine-glyoxylate transaminase/serine-pyruvate transaminase